MMAALPPALPLPAPLAELPALPLHEAGKYVAGAYIVAFVIVLIYVAIMAIRLGRIERELGELLELSEGGPSRARDARAREDEQGGQDGPDSDGGQLEAPGIERTPA
jgi:hypothetical protein